MKICFKCGIEKPLIEYYVHKGMADGYLGKCKVCTQNDTKLRADELLKDNEWVKQEQKRHREKYHRLGYKEKHKPTAEYKKTVMKKWELRYPEKVKIHSFCSSVKPQIKGNNLHHWSYNIEHAKDCIELPMKEHYKLHRFIIYDQERFMYRRVDTMELLDTKEKHLEYYNIIKHLD
jgi:hypothetical protein